MASRSSVSSDTSCRVDLDTVTTFTLVAMFMIGDFANLARVSTRVLRHYDRIGLLTPMHVDANTGYRYYSAAQLAEVNQIIALRDLGFGLAEIGEMTGESPSPSELRSMLTLRQAQVAAELEAAELRLRRIDSRITQLEEHAVPIDLVSRSIPSMSVWTMPYQTACIEEAFDALSCMVRDISAHVEDPVPPYGLARWTSDFDEEGFPVELAIPIDERLEEPAARMELTETMLPAVEVVSAVRSSGRQDIHVTNAAIGRWIENESAHIAGPIREVLLADPAVGDVEQVVEVQVPITR